MSMVFTFPGGSRVHGQAGPFTIPTDQPPDATAPSPFTLFLASIGACAGVYVAAFCQRRGIPTDDIRIVQHHVIAPTGAVERVELSVELPPDFPEQYRSAVVRSAEHCTVKQHLEHPPVIAIRAVIPQAAGARG
jgi:ribosomal protein S12 methylthiotransferase accessory factor